MKKSKIIIPIVSVVAGAGVVTGGIFGARFIQQKRLVAEVHLAEDYNYGYWDGGMQSSGMVVNDAAQSVYVTGTQTIKEVFVEEGQAVSKGDPLIEFDVSTMELSVEIKKLQIQDAKNRYDGIMKEIERLKQVKPISPNAPDAPEDPSIPSTPATPQKTEDGRYQYLDAKVAEALEMVKLGGDGTVESPYILNCAKDCLVYGEFLNAIGETGEVVALQVAEGTEITSTWTIYGESLSVYDNDSRYNVVTREAVYDDLDDGLGNSDDSNHSNESLEPTYTEAELAKLIRQKENDAKSLDLSRRRAEMELEELKKSLEDGIVYARMDGIMKTVGDPDDIPNDGSAFLVLAGSEGLYIKGDVSELMLDQVEVGQPITCTSWETGETYSGTITAIDEYPNENPSYWGEGNRNVSYYSYTAHIDDTAGLTTGQYLDLMIGDTSNMGSGDKLFLDAAYVRTENGKSYVMKEQDGVLVKQYVATGRTEYGGYAIEIKDGLALDDYIAFPYGKTAKEGVRTKHTDE